MGRFIAVLAFLAVAFPALAQNAPPETPICAGKPCFTTANPGVVVSSPSTTGVAESGTTTAASNAVLKASSGNLYSLTVTTGATTGWVMVFDATSLPANGATGASLKYCFPIVSNGTLGGATFDWTTPASFTTGITVGFSSTACNSLTASATAFFYGQSS